METIARLRGSDELRALASCVRQRARGTDDGADMVDVVLRVVIEGFVLRGAAVFGGSVGVWSLGVERYGCRELVMCGCVGF